MIDFNKVPFIASQLNFVPKTAGLDAVTHSGIVVNEVDDNGLSHKVIKAGSQVNGAVKGLVLLDIDVTGTDATHQRFAPIMVGGYFINDASVLPAVLDGSSTLTLEEAAAQGLFPLNSEKRDMVRPDVAFDLTAED